jgi:hypothetical protein
MSLSEKYIAELRKTFPGQIALNIDQFCQVTGMTANSVRTMLSRRQLDLETFKPGRRRLILLTEVAKLLALKTSAILERYESIPKTDDHALPDTPWPSPLKGKRIQQAHKNSKRG